MVVSWWCNLIKCDVRVIVIPVLRCTRRCTAAVVNKRPHGSPINNRTSLDIIRIIQSLVKFACAFIHLNCTKLNGFFEPLMTFMTTIMIWT